MKLSRRDLALLMPVLAQAQQPASRPVLPPKVHHHNEIPYVGDDKKKGRRFFYGTTHGGFNMEMHETILGRGTETHAPHKHEHEEVVIVVEGAVEAYLDGKTEVAETGSVIYFGSNQMHSARAVGKGACRYYVLELRGNEA
jgi:XRE family transcriptional regulator, regulator of sulfur utilization